MSYFTARIGWLAPLTACVAAAALVAPAPAGARAPDPPAACTIERLDEHVAWQWSTVTGADPTGRYIVGNGWGADPGNAEAGYPVIWDRGVRKPVPVPGELARLEDVNSTGVAVGSSRDPVTLDPTTPWVYRGGRVLALPGVPSGYANAVNERGDIVGNTVDGVALWWPAYSTTRGPRKLPLPDGATLAIANDIDEDGTIVGTYFDKDGAEHGLVWLPNGKIKTLEPPPGLLPVTRAFSIRDGWVTGHAHRSDVGTVEVRWHLPSGVTRTLPQFFYTTYVNAAGWVAGTSHAATALVATDAGDLKLPGLAEDNPQGVAVALTDDGSIVAGDSTDKEGVTRAVRWHCA